LKGGGFISVKKKIQIAIITALVLFDIMIVPWIVSIILCLFDYGISQGIDKAVTIWLNLIKDNPLYFTNIFTNKKLLLLWLTFQPIFLAFLYHIIFDHPRKRKNKITADIGGPEAAGGGEHGTSRWMTDKEIEKTFDKWDCKSNVEKSGTVFGIKSMNSKNTEHKLYYDTQDRHTLLIATSRSGKTRRVIIPKIWLHAKAGESIIATDPKGELYRKTHKYLRRNGYDVVLMDFRNPARSNQWNPMYRVVEAINRGDHSKAAEEAWDIANTIVNKKEHKGDPLWPNGEESTIASLILATAYEANSDELKHMGSTYSLFYKMGVPDEEGRLPLMEYINSLPDNHMAKAAFATAASAPYRTRASFFTSASADLRLWSMPSIVYMTSKQDHRLEDVGKKKTAVFLVIPDEKSTTHFLATLYLAQTYQALVELANSRPDNRLPVRVNFELDEFGNLPPIPDFATKITVAAGRGMRFTLVVQDLSQLDANYGQLARTIRGNCHIWLYLLTTDLDTASYISKMTGEYTISTESFSSTVRTKDYSAGVSEGTTGRYLLTPNEVMRWPDNQCLIFTARNFPARLPLPDLSQWPADAELDNDSDDLNFDPKIPILPTWTPDFQLQEKEEVKPKYHFVRTIKSKKEDANNEIKEEKRGGSILDNID